MIIDKLQNAPLYENLGAGFKKGFEWLKTTNLERIEKGEYELSKGVVALVNEYNTKDANEATPEAHVKNIDIQYIVKGKEYIGFAPLVNQEVEMPYNLEKDLIFYKAETVCSELNEGMFAVYFPTDIHQPGIMIKESAAVKKVVIKIAIE